MPTLALSTIVKNAERDLPDCLASVRGIVDQIVIADTGSTDASKEVARGLGVKVISIPWENDFSKARNLALSKVTCDWVLMLDADERIDPGAASLMPGHLANKNVAGYQVTIRNYRSSLTEKVWDRPARPNDSEYAPAKQYPAYVDHENVRLFRRDPEIYFVGRVHETVGHRILETGRKLGTANFLIHHFGMVADDQTMARKLFFYRELGRQKLVDSPNDAQAHLEMGIMELENFGNAEEASRHFERSCELNSKFGVAWFFAGKSQFQLGKYPLALRSFERAEAAGHNTPAIAELAGDALYNLGNYEGAIACYRHSLKRSPENAQVESKLGLAEARAGNAAPGLEKLHRAIGRKPANAELHDRLIMVEVWLNRLPDAAKAAEAKLYTVSPCADDFLRAASIRVQMCDWAQAAEILRQGIAKCPDSESLRRNLAKVEQALGPLSASLG
jgi:tetratricopeptide (TPR) repeat protein